MMSLEPVSEGASQLRAGAVPSLPLTATSRSVGAAGAGGLGGQVGVG